MKTQNLIRFLLTNEEKELMKKNFLNAKKFALQEHNIRLTKSKIIRRVFLDFLQDEDFIKKILK